MLEVSKRLRRIKDIKRNERLQSNLSIVVMLMFYKHFLCISLENWNEMTLALKDGLPRSFESSI